MTMAAMSTNIENQDSNFPNI